MVLEAPSFLGEIVHPPTLKERCHPSFYDPLKHPWHAIREAVMTAERKHFPYSPETEETLFGLFFHPESIVGVVTEADPLSGQENLAGYSIVVPADVEYSLPGTEFAHRLLDTSDETAYVHCTQIFDGYKGNGLVAGLNDLVMEEIATEYAFLERDALTKEGYAQKLLDAYAGKIVGHFPHPSVHGEQEFMRISLAEQTYLYR